MGAHFEINIISVVMVYRNADCGMMFNIQVLMEMNSGEVTSLV